MTASGAVPSPATALEAGADAIAAAAISALGPVAAGLIGTDACTVLGGVGIDIVDIALVARHAHRPAYQRQLCNEDEIAACLRTPEPAAEFAERFALKEACMKALGAGIRHGIWFRQIEVVSAAGEQPRLRLQRRALERFRGLGAHTLSATVARNGPVVVALVLVGTASGTAFSAT